MRVFIAGATGAIGRRLVPQLVRAGHEVTGMTRSAAKVDGIRSAGAAAAVADALDRDAMIKLVAHVAPDVVIHELTELPAMLDMHHMEQQLAATNRLRTEGLDILLEAAGLAGCKRIVAQSYAGWPYARTGGSVKTEEDPLDPDPPAELRSALDAIRYLEKTVTSTPGVTGLALRYGAFYGPGAALGKGGALLEQVRRRKVPIFGDGGGVWSFVHLDDAANATVCAVMVGSPGVYNVVDDEPAAVSVWLPALAEMAGAKQPLHLPALVGQMAMGEHGVMMMTDVRGASNAKAKRELGWQPVWKTWREGFRHGLA